MTTHPEVKFPRDIIEGIHGKDVIAHKRALSRARPDIYPWHVFSPYAGEYFLNAIVRWKKSRGLGKTRKLGLHAHDVLERTHAKNHPTEWAFDSRAIKLAKDYWDAVTKTPDELVRDRIVAAGFFWYAHRWNIAYSQYRPMPLGRPPFVPFRIDCSGFTTICYYAGGAPDPNGRGYDHLGYTGTLMDHGSRVNHISDLLPGDMVFYGYSYPRPGFNRGDPTHVALYVGDGKVLSMGSYPMKYYPYNYRRDVNHFRHYRVT